MKANIASWTKEALGRSLSLTEWLNSPSAQDKVAQFKLGQAQKKYGSWESAAAVWFSGQPNPNSTSSDGGNTVRQYVDKVGKARAGGKQVLPDGLADDLTDITTGGVKGALEGDPSGGILGALGGITKPFADVATAMLGIGKFAEFLLRLALPSTWVRIVCGLLGLSFLMFGLVVLGLEAKGT